MTACGKLYRERPANGGGLHRCALPRDPQRLYRGGPLVDHAGPHSVDWSRPHRWAPSRKQRTKRETAKQLGAWRSPPRGRSKASLAQPSMPGHKHSRRRALPWYEQLRAFGL